jgi:hypothetical protein
VSLT